MDIYNIVLMLLIAAGAFFAGYQTGRLSALSGRRGTHAGTEASPLPGPNVDRDWSQDTPARRSAPPPASAGGAGGAAQAPGAAPRRSTKPPPAAAGLMSTGNGSVDKTSS